MKFNFKTSYIVAIVAALIVLLLFGNRMFFIIDAGERGVVFRPYTSGMDTENIYSEGFHVIAPWNRLYIYPVREQQREETMEVLDRNGLSLSIESRYVSTWIIRNRILQNLAPTMSMCWDPEVRSTVRQVSGALLGRGNILHKKSRSGKTIKMNKSG